MKSKRGDNTVYPAMSSDKIKKEHGVFHMVPFVHVRTNGDIVVNVPTIAPPAGQYYLTSHNIDRKTARLLARRILQALDETG